MRGSATTMLFVFIVRGHGKGLVDQLIDELSDWALNAWSLHQASLENTTLAKQMSLTESSALPASFNVHHAKSMCRVPRIQRRMSFPVVEVLSSVSHSTTFSLLRGRSRLSCAAVRSKSDPFGGNFFINGQIPPPRSVRTAAAPPVTLLGGFLGAGKTTALQHILTNRAGLKIAVLVNDVAAVNVDAATLRRRSVESDGVEMIELENGCVCCGPGSGALAPQVLSLTERINSDGSNFFDQIVIELSGVADPANVQANLRNGGVDTTRKVALVDANAFPGQWVSRSRIRDRHDLAGADVMAQDPSAVDQAVVELLLQQVETADVILVNKCDLATADELRTTLAACRALNPQAAIVSTTYGDAKLQEILPLGASSAEGQHKHAHDHEVNVHGHAHHDHSHKDEGEAHAAHSHHHAHEHSHSGEEAHAAHSHHHAHDHSHSEGTSCSDPLCTDPAHNHDHHAVPNSAEALGFQTHVYRARRPFSAQRLVSLIKKWPLPKKMLSVENIASPGADGLAQDMEGKDPTFVNVLRSKGIAWLDTQHEATIEWSHAGRHFNLSPGGSWWVTLPLEIMRAALSNSGEDTFEESDAYKAERANFEDFGDRRQEIVFIGTNLNTHAIDDALNGCLVTDAEMNQYRAVWANADTRNAELYGPFRFAVGTRVECRMDDPIGGPMWKRGVVQRQYYRQRQWPVEQWTPYQVELDEGQLIWVPADSDIVIRRA